MLLIFVLACGFLVSRSLPLLNGLFHSKLTEVFDNKELTGTYDTKITEYRDRITNKIKSLVGLSLLYIPFLSSLDYVETNAAVRSWVTALQPYCKRRDHNSEIKTDRIKPYHDTAVPGGRNDVITDVLHLSRIRRTSFFRI